MILINLTQLTNFNLQDLLLLCSYLALNISIFYLIFACLAILTVTLPFVIFYGRIGKNLNTAAKLVVIAACSSNLYKNQEAVLVRVKMTKTKTNTKIKQLKKKEEYKKLIIKLKKLVIRTQMVIQQRSNQWINHFKLNRNIKITQSFLFGFIFSQLDLNVDDTASNLTQISYGFFLLSLVALICFINVIGFMITYIIIQQGNYEIKYPKLSKIINYYKKSTLIYVSIEVCLCLICLILLVCYSFLLVYSGIKT